MEEDSKEMKPWSNATFLALLADTGLQGLAACRMYASVDLHKGVSYTLFWISLNNQCAHATTGNMVGAWGHGGTVARAEVSQSLLPSAV
jgi:hypothetical protein